MYGPGHLYTYVYMRCRCGNLSRTCTVLAICTRVCICGVDAVIQAGHVPYKQSYAVYVYGLVILYLSIDRARDHHLLTLHRCAFSRGRSPIIYIAFVYTLLL